MDKISLKSYIRKRVVIVSLFYIIYIFVYNYRNDPTDGLFGKYFLLGLFGFLILCIWIAWITIEMIVYYFKKQTRLARTNLILLIVMIGIPFGINYLRNHCR